MNKVMATIGFIAFAIGILLAVIFGIFPFNRETINLITIILILLGLIIGILNITTRERQMLLLATIALVVVGNVFEPLSTFGGIGEILDNILKLIATLMAPAAVVVAIRILAAVGFPRD